jgi:hypothetical protein
MDGIFRYFGSTDLNKEELGKVLKEMPVYPLAQNKKKYDEQAVNLGELVFNVKLIDEKDKSYSIIPVSHKDVKVTGYYGQNVIFAFHELVGLRVKYDGYNFNLITNKK